MASDKKKKTLYELNSAYEINKWYTSINTLNLFIINEKIITKVINDVQIHNYVL